MIAFIRGEEVTSFWVAQRFSAAFNPAKASRL
jgi:hypothetical protein